MMKEVRDHRLTKENSGKRSSLVQVSLLHWSSLSCVLSLSSQVLILLCKEIQLILVLSPLILSWHQLVILIGYLRPQETRHQTWHKLKTNHGDYTSSQKVTNLNLVICKKWYSIHSLMFNGLFHHQVLRVSSKISKFLLEIKEMMKSLSTLSYIGNSLEITQLVKKGQKEKILCHYRRRISFLLNQF